MNIMTTDTFLRNLENDLKLMHRNGYALKDELLSWYFEYMYMWIRLGCPPIGQFNPRLDIDTNLQFLLTHLPLNPGRKDQYMHQLENSIRQYLYSISGHDKHNYLVPFNDSMEEFIEEQFTHEGLYKNMFRIDFIDRQVSQDLRSKYYQQKLIQMKYEYTQPLIFKVDKP